MFFTDTINDPTRIALPFLAFPTLRDLRPQNRTDLKKGLCQMRGSLETHFQGQTQLGMIKSWTKPFNYLYWTTSWQNFFSMIPKWRDHKKKTSHIFLDAKNCTNLFFSSEDLQPQKPIPTDFSATAGLARLHPSCRRGCCRVAGSAGSAGVDVKEKWLQHLQHPQSDPQCHWHPGERRTTWDDLVFPPLIM